MRQATEAVDVETARSLLAQRIPWMRVLVCRLERLAELRPPYRALDIGAGQGLNVIALKKAGHDAVGLEPSARAIAVSAELSTEQGVDAEMVQGVAESLPFPDHSFDVVLAQSVLEHVVDPEIVVHEIHRVLRPGGAFYFHTTNALCPRQSEIDGFPLFPWYPPPIRRAIMRWAAEKRPELVGGTQTPAYHWFSPWSTRRLLRSAGFRRVADHWDLKLDDRVYLSRPSRIAVRVAHSNRVLRVLGDVFITSSAYVGVK